MPYITFTHPQVKPNKLTIDTGADQIYWSYNLNINRVPTYGGEVVQILSCNIDNLNISGTCRAYTTGSYSSPGIQEIYAWFGNYMQIASQGYGTANGSYNSYPITMSYPARGWSLQFQALQASQFQLDIAVVAPAYTIMGKVVNSPEPMNQLTLNTVLSKTDVKAFVSLQDGIDLKQPDPSLNPYQSPYPSKSAKVNQQQAAKDEKLLGNYWTSLIQAWSGGTFADLTGANLDTAFGASTSNAKNVAQADLNKAASKYNGITSGG